MHFYTYTYIPLRSFFFFPGAQAYLQKNALPYRGPVRITNLYLAPERGLPPCEAESQSTWVLWWGKRFPVIGLPTVASLCLPQLHSIGDHHRQPALTSNIVSSYYFNDRCQSWWISGCIIDLKIRAKESDIDADAASAGFIKGTV